MQKVGAEGGGGMGVEMRGRVGRGGGWVGNEHKKLVPKTPRPVASADFLRVYVCNVCMYVGRWQVCRQVGR